MHSYIQDDQIGQEIVLLAAADMDRLSPLMTTKNIVVNGLVC
jgi:hypothetical protein